MRISLSDEELFDLLQQHFRRTATFIISFKCEDQRAEMIQDKKLHRLVHPNHTVTVYSNENKETKQIEYYPAALKEK